MSVGIRHIILYNEGLFLTSIRNFGGYLKEKVVFDITVCFSGHLDSGCDRCRYMNQLLKWGGGETAAQACRRVRIVTKLKIQKVCVLGRECV